MKKLSKFIYFIFAFALIACMSIFNPAIDFVSADGSATDTDKSISISNSKIESTVEAGEDLIIPVPTVSSATAKKFIVVTDRSGTQYTYDCETKKTLDKNGNEVTVKEQDVDVPVKYFTLLNKDKQDITANGVSDTVVAFIKVAKPGKGTYTVQYKVTEGNKTYYSDAKQVQVKSVAYSWEFNAEDTAKNIIPSITNANSTYTLPLPKILNNLDEDETEEYTAADVAAKKIIVTNGGKDVTNDVIDVTDDGKVLFTPTLEGTDSDTYTIKYVSKVTAFPDKVFTVKVEKDYNTKAELEVTHNAITNYQVGAVTTFPTANVTDKTHNKSSVEVNNVIVIKQNGTEYARLNANQYTYKFTEAGTYTIYYEVTDAYGNTATSKATSITLSDKKPYKVTYADSYKVTTDAQTGEVTISELNTNVTANIPNEVGFGGFWLPAIYAEDYVDSYDKLEFSRKLVSTADSSIYFDLDSNDATHGNAAYGENQAKGLTYNDEIYFEFPAVGDTVAQKTAYIKEKYAGTTFKLVYTAKDSKSSNTEAKATEYIIKVAGEDVLTNNVDKNLIIKFATINDEIDPNAELTFTTATAKEEPTDSSLVADERIDVKTFYYYGAKTKIEGLLNSYIQKLSTADTTGKYIEKYGYIFEDFQTYIATQEPDLDINKLDSIDGKTTIKLTGYTSQPKVTIFAVAINDQKQFVIKAQEVAINNTNELVAPIISNVSFETGKSYTDQLKGMSAFNQNYEVTLPSVTFTDEIDKSLQVDIKCYVDTPDQTVGITIDEFIQKATGECGIQTAKLTTTYAGTYYIVYTATDDAGNKATYISTFDVAKTEKAYIEVENGSNLTKNVGDEVKLNINLAGNGEYTNQEITVTWGENKPSGLGSTPNSYKFNKAGTYVATINATYTMNGVKYEDTPSVTVTITVTEPDMEWEDNIDQILVNRTADINEKIELPVISAIENETYISTNVKVVFVGEDDKEVDIIPEYDHNDHYYFVADKDGVYTVTYTATTAYNSESKSFTVTCGDHYDPTIALTSNKLQDSTVTYNGKDINVSVTFTQQEDENDDKITGKYTLTVIGKDADNKELFNYDIDVDLKDTDAEGAYDYFTPDTWSFSLTGDSVSSNGTNKWTIKGVGDYKLTLTVKDDNGNAATETIEFKVSNKTEPKSIKDNVVGIVLIVVSVVLLGGVILFFAFAGKRNKSKRTSVRINKD